MNNKKELFDCIITCGELDPERYGKLLRNEYYKYEIVKHAITKEEAETWLYSDECRCRKDKLRSCGEQMFGRDHWKKFHVSCFYTISKV